MRAEFERLKGRKDTHRRVQLEAFQRRLGELTFFDPACGSGNFLIIAYREIRALEIEVIRELEPYRALDQMELSTGPLGVLDDVRMRSVIHAIGHVIDSDCEPT